MRAFDRFCPENGHHRLARRHLVIGKIVRKLIHRKIDPCSYLGCDIDSLRQIFEEAEHLLMVFQITFAVFGQQFARVVDRRVIFYTGKYVKQLTVVMIGVICTVTSEIGKPQFMREAEERLVYRFFAAQVMTL